MQEFTENERSRLDALASYNILDTASEEDYDELTELAAAICGTPIALISLVDAGRQWFKSHKGLDVSETERSQSFCAHAILNPTEIMQVEDAHLDDRFKDNPLVTGEPHIAFYAGVPLVDKDGYALGSLCVIDRTPKQLSDTQQKALRTLAKQVIGKLELRRRNRELETANAKLQQADIEYKEVNTKRIHSDSRLRSLLQQAPVAIIVFRGQEMEIEEVNPAMLRLLNKNEDILQKKLLDAIPELNGQEPYYLLHHVFETGHPQYGYDTPVQLVRNGVVETGYFNFIYTPLIEDGLIVGVIDMAVEVTEQVNTRKLLEENESRLQNILDTVSEGIGLTDTEGNITYVNQRARAILKMNEQSILARNTGSSEWNNRRLDGAPMPREEHPLSIAVATGQPVYNKEFSMTSGDEEPVYLRMNATPIRDVDGKITGAIGSFADITQSYLLRQEMETINAQLREQEERLHMAIASANLGTWYIDIETRQFIPSVRLKELFGYYPDEVMPYEAAITQIADTHRNEVAQAVEAAITSGTAYDLEYPITGYHTGELRWVRATGQLFPATNENKRGHFSGTIADVTERRLDEQRRSDFIGIVSHELRNPLTSINGYMQIMNMRAQSASDAFSADLVTKSLKQVDKMKALIKGFLDVARMGEGKIQLDYRVFDMAELIKAVEEESLATVTTHTIIYHPVEYTEVNADRDKIEQVIINFVNNAVKYSSKSSTINVACVSRDGYAHVSVVDEGMGIPQKDLPRIFDRFYRVESESMQKVTGFGIGLYICKEIIERHGGQIGVESVEGKGSTFWFNLPIYTASQA